MTKFRESPYENSIAKDWSFVVSASVFSRLTNMWNLEYGVLSPEHEETSTPGFNFCGYDNSILWYILHGNDKKIIGFGNG